MIIHLLVLGMVRISNLHMPGNCFPSSFYLVLMILWFFFKCKFVLIAYLLNLSISLLFSFLFFNCSNRNANESYPCKTRDGVLVEVHP